MKVKINKYVVGAPKQFHGYIFNGATEKANTTRVVGFAQCFMDIQSLTCDYPHFWLIPTKDKYFVLLRQEKYTNFPEHMRFYNQKVFSWFDNDDVKEVGFGALLSSCKLFKQYDRGEKVSDELEIIPESVPSVSKELIERLTRIVAENKKLLIEIDTEGLSLTDNAFTDFLPFKKLFYALGALTDDVRQKISVSTMMPHEGFAKAKVQVGTTTKLIPAKEAYYTLWSGSRYSKDSTLASLASLVGLAEFHEAVPENPHTEYVYKDMNFSDEGAPKTNILIHYGKVKDTLRQRYYENEGFEIVGQDVLQ